MKEECLICQAPLEYLETDTMMECAICHKRELSKTRCRNGHYVCSTCHTRGMDAIIGRCLQETSRDPVAILEKMMAMPFCHMHGPEHHVMVGCALLTAYKNAGGEIDLGAALHEMMSRGKSVPGGACGFWGACGAGVSAGMFVSIVTHATPLTMDSWGLSNRMTAKALEAIGRIGGPRCCKRDSYLAILAAIGFVEEHFGVVMERQTIVCTRSAQNNQCIGKRCPFSKARHPKEQEPFDLYAYLDRLIAACKAAFGERLVYVGLQGSYLRGEATADSDIDVMIVLDRLAPKDLDAYQALLKGLGQYEKSCGFICGRDELQRWNPLEVCQLLHTTKDLFGTLADLLPKASRADEISYVRLSLGNLYHELCHRYIHTDREHSVRRFRGTCKQLFFLIQNLHYLESGVFVVTKKELKEAVSEEDRRMLELSELADGFDFDSAFSSLLEWCQKAFVRIDETE